MLSIGIDTVSQRSVYVTRTFITQFSSRSEFLVNAVNRDTDNTSKEKRLYKKIIKGNSNTNKFFVFFFFKKEG